MKKQRIVLGLQGLVSGYTLLHHKEEEPDDAKSPTPTKSIPKPLDTKSKT